MTLRDNEQTFLQYIAISWDMWSLHISWVRCVRWIRCLYYHHRWRHHCLLL